MDMLQAVCQLREVLRELEHDIGLDQLSTTERDVLLAAYSLTSAPGNVIESFQIRNHCLVKSIPQASFHRALKALLTAGFLERSKDSKAKTYIVRADAMSMRPA